MDLRDTGGGQCLSHLHHGSPWALPLAVGPAVLQFAEAVAIFAALPQNVRGQRLQIGGGGFALPTNEVDAAAAGFDVYLPMWPQNLPHDFVKARQRRAPVAVV